MGTERCVCHEVLDHVAKVFEVSPAVKQHLMNSRLEFLKAIRAVIDQRIEHLSGTPSKGRASRSSKAKPHPQKPRMGHPEIQNRIALPREPYTHSPARMTGSELPAAVMPSTSM